MQLLKTTFTGGAWGQQLPVKHECLISLFKMLCSSTEWWLLCLPAGLHFCFHNCQAPSKKRTHFTQNASRSGLSMTSSTMMRVSGCGRGRILVTFVQWESFAVSDRLWLVLRQSGDAIGVALQSNLTLTAQKKNGQQTWSISKLEKVMSLFMIRLILLDRKPLAFPLCLTCTQSGTFFNNRFCFVTTLGDSYCLQVIGSAGRWSQVRNESTLGYT